MAPPSTLYRFRIDLTDVTRDRYEHLDFRVALHPSETEIFLITRVLAYALNIQDGLEFSKGGLSDTEAPALSALHPGGGQSLWIEIGNPSPRKLHKATKGSQSVKIYTYKNPELLIQDLVAEPVYKPERMELFSFASDFLETLTGLLVKDNSWNIIHNDHHLMIQIGDETIESEVRNHSLEKLKK